MRLRSTALASLLTALVTFAVPSAVNAAPRHNRGLTINAVPHHIMAGEGVLIYGQLKGPNPAHQAIRLFHHINPFPGYALVGTTVTDANGFYQFTRQEGVVDTNRSWFVRGPDKSHSRTVFERVDALVSLGTTNTTFDTLHPVVFFGRVFPNHPFERVLLEQRVSGDDWRVLTSGFTGGGSNFRIVYRFKVPGSRDLRAVFVGDSRNLRGFSDPLTVDVQQAQIAGFTITSYAPVIDYGHSAVISGVLDAAGTTTAASGVPVTLFARTPSQAWQGVANGTTGPDGRYSFPAVSPQSNTLYVVRVTLAPHRHSAYLFEGVRDVVSASPSATTSTVGSAITFTGQVTPSRLAGDVVYLQRLGKDGDWHTVKVALTNGAGAYSLAWTLGDVGTDTFRVRALGDRLNFGGVSAPMSIMVNPASSPQALAPAS